jgi:hypothetical protein
MSRAVRFALWDYQTGQALTKECDADVDAFCPKVRCKSVTRRGTKICIILRA